MILILTFPEKMALAKGGGFDKVAKVEGWIESLIQGSIKLQDREMYIFRGHWKQLDFIANRLAEKARWKMKMKNFFDTPTFAELLAARHGVKDMGKLNLYVDHRLPLQDQRRRMLFGTYRATEAWYYDKYLRECISRRPYLKVELPGLETIVTLGYYQSGYVSIADSLYYWHKYRLMTNVLDAVDYPMLLLKSIL